MVTYTLSFCQEGVYKVYIITRTFFIFLTSEADDEKRVNDEKRSVEDRINRRKIHKWGNFVTICFLSSSSAFSERRVIIARRKTKNNIFQLFLTIIFMKCEAKTT
jgi:hypothetical protein